MLAPARPPKPPSNLTHCPKGHAYTPENTAWRETVAGTPTRRCKTCARAQTDKYKKRKAKEAQARDRGRNAAAWRLRRSEVA